MRLFVIGHDDSLHIYKVIDERMPFTAIGMNFHLDGGDILFIHPQNVKSLLMKSEDSYEKWVQINEQLRHQQEVDKIEKEKLGTQPKIIS